LPHDRWYRKTVSPLAWTCAKYWNRSGELECVRVYIEMATVVFNP
jgi:hypothetical protein